MAEKKGTILFDGANAEPKSAAVNFDSLVEVPALPSAEGEYRLHIASDGTATWVAIPALPTAEGDYKLHIASDGTATWVEIPAAEEAAES